jgi:hypothetical protein
MMLKPTFSRLDNFGMAHAKATDKHRRKNKPVSDRRPAAQ